MFDQDIAIKRSFVNYDIIRVNIAEYCGILILVLLHADIDFRAFSKEKSQLLTARNHALVFS